MSQKPEVNPGAPALRNTGGARGWQQLPFLTFKLNFERHRSDSNKRCFSKIAGTVFLQTQQFKTRIKWKIGSQLKIIKGTNFGILENLALWILIVRNSDAIPIRYFCSKNADKDFWFDFCYHQAVLSMIFSQFQKKNEGMISQLIQHFYRRCCNMFP